MNKNINFIKEPKIEMVKGFFPKGINCGLKKDKYPDLGVVYSEVNADTFAVFTTNKVKGAPIYVAKKHLKNHKAQMVVVNSKIANACTGEQGIKNSFKICEEAGLLFNVKKNDVIPMSTGVIGEQLPVDKLIQGLKGLYKEKESTKNFLKAIMTTDTKEKIVGVKIVIKGKSYSIIGVCKGSGMIHPNMATMLALIFTDAVINPKLLKKAFTNSIDKSFNSITVDGDTSTSDTAIILANGLAQNEIINKKASEDYKVFCEGLEYIATELAKKIIRDGEGATKFIEINIKNAKSIKDAKVIGKSIANSSLVKTAFFGNDANWGRIICAIGYSDAYIIPEKIELSINNIKIYKDGMKTNFDEKKMKSILQKGEILVDINLNLGNYNWTIWTTDLSYDYIKINASYRS